jgi:hypothetical protein
MTDAKAELVRSWLTKAQHDLASARVLAASKPPLAAPTARQFNQALSAAQGLYQFVLSLLPEEMRPTD